MARIKKGDQVIVIAGKDKGKTGRVLEVLKGTDRVIVEGVQRVTTHQGGAVPAGRPHRRHRDR